MKTILIKDFTFRAKKMNAIEMLAMRSQIDFEDYSKTVNMYELFLNNMEVELNGEWLPVREVSKSGKASYYPAGLEDDGEMVEKLVSFFMQEVLMPVFTNSNGSN